MKRKPAVEPAATQQHKIEPLALQELTEVSGGGESSAFEISQYGD